MLPFPVKILLLIHQYLLGLASFILNFRFIACTNLHGCTEIMMTIIRVQNIMNQGIRINVTNTSRGSKKEHRPKTTVITHSVWPWTESGHALLFSIRQSIMIPFVFHSTEVAAVKNMVCSIESNLKFHEKAMTTVSSLCNCNLGIPPKYEVWCQKV